MQKFGRGRSGRRMTMGQHQGNLGDLVRRSADAVALFDASEPDGNRTRSYQALDANVAAVARGLSTMGLGIGDRVAIVSANRLEFVEVLFGCMRAGCVPVPVNTRLPDDDIDAIMRDAGARLIFADAANSGRAPSIGRSITFGLDGANGYASFLDYGDHDAIDPDPDTVALQPYTSGSTGTPKGVMLSHAGALWNCCTIARARELGPSTRSLIAAPLFHKNGLNTLKQTFAAGGQVVLVGAFDPETYLNTVLQFRCTQLAGVPAMFARLLEQNALIAETDLSFVTRVAFGSGPASDALFDALTTAFPNAAIENNYGITEGGPVVFGPHPEGLPRPRNSVGFPLADGEVKLTGDNPDQGVLSVRNPGVMLGYHNQPRETDARLQNGWLNTGDIFRRDENGFYFFVGRDDEMFVCSGENLYPNAIAAMLERHPDIVQAAVVPRQHTVNGQVPYAFVIARNGAKLDEAKVKEFALSNGPSYAHPRHVVFVDQLPITGTGKVDSASLARAAHDMPAERH